MSDYMKALVDALLASPSWLDQATQQTQNDITAYRRGGVLGLMANTQPAQGLLGGFVGGTLPSRMPATNMKGMMRIPIEDIEHGESAMPGGKMTWPGADEVIRDYATRPTPIPPIRAIAPDAENPKWMVEDGSHRLEAAKLRGDTHILVIPTGE